MKRIGEAGVPCSAVFDTRDLFNDPHRLSRGFVKTVEHEAHGPVQLLGWPTRMSASEVEIKAAPLLGQHTAEVLADDLGLDEDALRALREQGAIAYE
jgi:formyl-CoA transferase